MQTATLPEVFEAVANAGARNRKVSLLIGAGCSVIAGIPSAAGIVKEIEKQRPKAFEAARLAAGGAAPGYQECMARLPPRERQDLMAGYVDKARINWAHIGIACLIKAGIVDRVLTVNFDPRIVRACALLDVFPGVYDFAASQIFDASHVADRAVFYLHGQQSGFVHLHTREQVETHAAKLAPVFGDAGRDRLWIVVGYSGVNDPVVTALAGITSFANGLYWIGRTGSSPPTGAAADLLTSARSGSFVKAAGADEFFIELAQCSDCFPPPIFATPFTHLTSVYETLVQEFPTTGMTRGASGAAHPLEQPKAWITAAVAQFEQPAALSSGPALSADTGKSEASFVLDRFLAGDHDAIVARYEADPGAVPKETVDNVSRSFTLKGNRLGDHANTTTGAKADHLYVEAAEKYATALAIKPDLHQALNNWGLTLCDQAKTKSGDEADRLFVLAGQKYAAALAIKSDDHAALYNWGNALAAQAKARSGDEADRLYVLASLKYAAALDIKPDDHEALNNWGVALAAQAKSKSGDEADRLFDLASQRYAAAVAIKPDKHEALNGWAILLIEHAKTKTGAEADRLFALADHKAAQASAISPGSGDYDRACIASLRGEPDAARGFLESSRDHGRLPRRGHLASDTDLNAVRSLPWFAAILDAAKA